MGSKQDAAGIFADLAPSSSRDLYRIYGTTEPPKLLRRITKGPLTFLYSDAAIRQIEWHNTEVIRAIAWPIRDTSWGTYSPEILDANLIETDDMVSGRLIQTVDDGKLECELYFEASSDGSIFAKVTMTPTLGNFTTNRAGLTVLHPIKGLAGEAVSVRHSDSGLKHVRFPKQISPDQPIKDIAGLGYSVDSTKVQIDFAGEVFEMEDQRNWSDASYKTYCVPLAHPFTYAIDRPIVQSVKIKIAGEQRTSHKAASEKRIDVIPTRSKAPDIGLAFEAGWGVGPQNAETITQCGASHLLVRAGASGTAVFSEAKALAEGLDAKVDLEVILDDCDDASELLALAAKNAQRQGLGPTRVIALPNAYLDSHQPSDEWPNGPTPNDIAELTRQAFPGALVGGGMLTNFTELNRCRPNSDVCDFITHGNSAIVHASDDRSVIETLETLPHIFESAQTLSDRPYRLGLVSIGMRSNPYGASIAENPSQVRETMAREDPRHRGLFGAAYAVGVLAATFGSRVEALCLAAPSGPFGIVYERQHYTQNGFDDGIGAIYPLFHVVRYAAEMASHPRLELAHLPDGLVGYGATVGDRHIAMIANVSSRRIEAHFSQPMEVSMLKPASFEAAVCDVDWIANSRTGAVSTLSFDPYTIGFLRL